MEDYSLALEVIILNKSLDYQTTIVCKSVCKHIGGVASRYFNDLIELKYKIAPKVAGAFYTKLLKQPLKYTHVMYAMIPKDKISSRDLYGARQKLVHNQFTEEFLRGHLVALSGITVWVKNKSDYNYTYCIFCNSNLLHSSANEVKLIEKITDDLTALRLYGVSRYNPIPLIAEIGVNSLTLGFKEINDVIIQPQILEGEFEPGPTMVLSSDRETELEKITLEYLYISYEDVYKQLPNFNDYGIFYITNLQNYYKLYSYLRNKKEIDMKEATSSSELEDRAKDIFLNADLPTDLFDQFMNYINNGGDQNELNNIMNAISNELSNMKLRGENSEDESKDESKDESNDESKEESKDESKDESKEESKDESKDESKEESKNNS